MKKTSIFFRQLSVLLSLVLIFSSLGAVNAAEKEPEDIYIRPLVGGVAQIAMSDSHVAVLRSDGTVAATGSNDWNQCQVSGWSRIVKIWATEQMTVGLTQEGMLLTTNAAMPAWTGIRDAVVLRLASPDVVLVAGLRSDGTVMRVAVGRQGMYSLLPGSCEVSGWRDVVQLAGTDRIYGLRSDGTVLQAGVEGYSPEISVAEWEDVRELVSTGGEIFGITGTGAVLSERSDFGCEDWTQIAQVTMGAEDTLFGLTRNGQVYSSNGSLPVAGLTGIRDVVGTSQRCVALGSDGTVTFAPEPQGMTWAQRGRWSDVQTLVYSPGSRQVAGVRYDGTVVAADMDDLSAPAACDGWTDIVRLYCSGARWLGIREDGSLIANFKGVDLTSLTEGVKDTRPENYTPGLMAAGIYHSVYVRTDGSISAAGLRSDGRLDVKNWTDIVAVSAYDHTVGLRADGTVVAVGKNNYKQCEVSGWQDIVDISAGGMNTVGLTASGTVVVAGSDQYGQLKLAGRKGIVDVEASGAAVYGLTDKGTVVAAGSNAQGECEVSGWTDIVAISAGTTHVVGIRSDGTVVAAGSNDYGQCDVSGWTDIVLVSAGGTHTVGVRANGSIVFAGSNEFGQGDLTGWKNVVAIDTGMYHTLAITSTGGILTAGSNGYGQRDIGH